MTAKPCPPPTPRITANRETFRAYARADNRQALMDAMRHQAEQYFGCPVELIRADAEANARQGDHNHAWRASSLWKARP